MITMSDEEQKGLTGFFSRFGSAKKQTVSEEEIKDIVADNDELADDEKRMIHDIIDLGDMSVHEIMQPRVDMIMVEDTETVRTAVERTFPGAQVIDGNGGTARQLKRLLEERGLARGESGRVGSVELITSGDPSEIELMRKLLNMRS